MASGNRGRGSGLTVVDVMARGSATDDTLERIVPGWNMSEASGFVLGRRTYEGFASHWPYAPEEEQVPAEPPNSKPKFVASTLPDDRALRPLALTDHHVTTTGAILATYVRHDNQ